ncbi:hypothetical protein AKO1_004873 [Acrasis kona]|uniref:Uncharacterized protein n=1 Tax=Acrasis kona TaxID=1008807 RepID=A0AAW2Z570_9EUKA
MCARHPSLKLRVSCCIIILLLSAVTTLDKPNDRRIRKQDTIDKLTEVVTAFQNPLVQQAFGRLLPESIVKGMLGDETASEWIEQPVEQSEARTMRTRRIQEEEDDDEKNLKEECDPTSIYATFDYQLFSCNGTNVTYVEYLEKKNVLNCTQTNTTMEACLCPLDRVGERCSTFRNYTCVVKLLDPQRNCQRGDDTEDVGGLLLDADHPCLEFSEEAVSQDFTFNMYCYFDESLSELQNYTNSLNMSLISNVTASYKNHSLPVTNLTNIHSFFDYFLPEYTYETNETYGNQTYTHETNKTFALTNPLKEPFQYQVINFYHLGDLSESNSTVMNNTKDYLGLSNFTFTVNLNVGPEHRAGNRIYVETGVFDAPGATVEYERMFLDVKDSQEPIYFDYTNVVLATVIPTVIIVGGVGSLIAYYVYDHKKRKNEEFFNPDLNKRKTD